MKKIMLILLAAIFYVNGICQDSTQGKFEWNGYVKVLQTVTFTNRFKAADYTNLIHNRVNFKWKPSGSITTSVELRNRFFWGSEARNITRTEQSLRNDNEKINLSVNWMSQQSVILHTNVERMWMEYRKPKWNVRAGRQRVNWGITNTWNPNDIFNTYNFLDFDFEERPGCDAIKIHFMVSDMSNIEIAAASAEKNKTIIAAKYFLNKKGYDIQLVTGVYKNSFTGGVGWAGNIMDLGFKGEAQFYLNNTDSLDFFNITTELDYIFKNGWYINGGILFNHKGLNSPPSDWSKINLKITPSNLMPAKWNMLIGTSKELTPIFTGTMAIVYSPGINMLIIFPSFKYNLFTNLDIDLVWQSFFSEIDTRFREIAHSIFIRAKWNF